MGICEGELGLSGWISRGCTWRLCWYQGRLKSMSECRSVSKRCGWNCYEAGMINHAHTSVVWEELFERHFGQFCSEQVDLVHEKNDGRPKKPATVDHGFKKHQTFSHAILKSVKAWVCKLACHHTWLTDAKIMGVPGQTPPKVLDRTHSTPRKRWWTWQPRSSGSTFFFLISVRRHRTCYSFFC